MGKTEKDVKPISGRQLGELCRLLEERGVDKEIFQRTMLENPDGLCFFLRGRFGQFVGKELFIECTADAYVRVVVKHTFGINNTITAVSRNVYDFAMGNTLMIGDDIFKKEDVRKKQKIGRVFSFHSRNEGQLVVEVKSLDGTSKDFLPDELSW